MDNNISGITQSYNNTKVAADYQGVVAKKALDVEKQAGNNTIDLIKSATGNNVDIKV